MSVSELYGLVLSGGRSRRMQRDKAGVAYGGKPQLQRAMELMAPLVARSFISIRQDQLHDPLRAAYQSIVDRIPDLGPIGGIHAALHAHPDKAWLVLACDLPFLDRATLERLIAARDLAGLAIAYRSQYDGLPEPLCAIYEPASRIPLARWIERGERCPRRFLAHHEVPLLDLSNTRALDNVNTPEEYAASQAAPRRVRIRYFALLREQAGRSGEELETSAQTALELYQQLRPLRGLALSPERLRVAVNDEFGAWDTRLADGDTVAFLPPVAGG